MNNACNKKNNLYKCFLKSRTKHSLNKYKVYKNKLTTILRNAEKDYYDKLLNSKQSDIKGTWKILNSMIKGNSSGNSYPEKFNDNGNCITDCKAIANGFNNFFTNVGPSLASKITAPNDNQCIFNTMGPSNVNSMFLHPVTEKELVYTINSCKYNYSCDFNDLSMNIVKCTFNAIIKPFMHICNLSFSNGVFPNDMKIAKIVPLFKSGDESIFSNYRPVSLLPQLSKILEKLFDKRLTDFVETHNILSNSQYGFRGNRSTAMALLDFMERVGSATDNKNITLGVFIDLKKAFDTIDHSLLIKKLGHYGVRGIASNWLKSYLLNRKQFVNFNGIKSELQDVICGVPQGSILGPKLFILYINDMCNITKVMDLIIFADDTNIFCTADNIKDLCKTVSLELNKFHTWFAINKLSLNISKTNFMVFGKKHLKTDCNIYINDFKIERVYVTKFLGVLIDSELSWKPQTVNIKNKLYRNLAVLKKVKPLLHKEALLKLYCSIFQSHLYYCVELWGNCSKTYLLPIIKAQKHAVRVICNLGSRDHTSSFFKELNILKFMDLVEFKILILMFKAWNVNLPKSLQCLFQSKTDNVYNTRRLYNFKVNFSKSKIKYNCLSSIGVRLWNKLDEKMKTSGSLIKF